MLIKSELPNGTEEETPEMFQHFGFTVDEVEVLEVLEELVELVDDVEPRFVPSSVGYGNGHDDSPFVATVMYLRQIVAGNEPPVTDIPCTDFMNVPSG